MAYNVGMSMKFDFSDLFTEINNTKDFSKYIKDIKDIKKEIAEVATSEMRRAIQEVYTINAPRLKGKAQKFVIPLPILQKAVVTEWKNNVVESYIDEGKLDHGHDANAEIFVDINGGLIAKRSMYRIEGLRVTEEDRNAGRQHPKEYYVRDMNEYWQMRIGQWSDREFIQKAWTFRLDYIKSYYFGEIEGCKKRWKELDEFKKMAVDIESQTGAQNSRENILSQKELDNIFDYFIEVQNSKFKFNEKERWGDWI